MRVALAQSHENETVEMRKAFCATLMEMAGQDEDIVLLDADLMAAMGTKPFAAAYPHRTVDCGIQEANMIGVAAGLAAAGLKPYAHTFGPFATRRACDQIFMSCAYARQNVKIIGSDPGVSAALNGGTHMPFEDIGIMRGFPEVTVIDPADNTAMCDILRQSKDHPGVWYIRLVRKLVPKIYSAGTVFTVGRANLLRQGGDVTLIASGLVLAQALKAAERLAGEGIRARVLDMFTIKPIDAEAILSAAEDTGAIVTAENHSIHNGLGSAVAEVLAEHRPVPMERVGVRDVFGEVGPVDYLLERFGLTADTIVEKARRAVARKRETTRPA